ncbi:MAG: membrane protein [Rhodococcus sp.]|nr:membrane protein [Rhodococcus sp. (in: high G+C Gram-positive bacteria)]
MLTRRLCSLFFGLWLYGFSVALVITAGVGLNPWGVFHEGMATQTSLSFGTVTVITGVVVLAMWVPLRERPGFGTVANVAVIGLSVDASLALLPVFDSLVARLPMMLVGVALNAVATVLYIGAGMGPGPRDGLMTGLVGRSGGSVRVVRTSIEVVVLGIGWILGGTLGVGTVVYALAIGPLVQLLMRMDVLVPTAPQVRRRAEAVVGT